MNKLAVLLVLGSFMAITIDAQTKTRQCRGEYKRFIFVSTVKSAREKVI